MTPRPLLVLAACALTACTQSGPPDTGPAPLTRPVTIDVGDLVLEGTLALPEALADAAPAVVLVHGTGPNGRDEVANGQFGLSFTTGFPLFAELSDLLVARGYAVLRYDKRTCGPDRCDNSYPSLPHEGVVSDFVADGAAVAEFLTQQPEVDPSRVAILGHSQGGAMVPAMLAASPSAAAGVVLAGPWSNLDVVARWQRDSHTARLQAMGATPEQIAQDLGDLPDLANTLTALFAGDDFPGAPWGTEAFLRDCVAMDLARPALAHALDRPVLAVSGDYDWNVSTDETLAWQTEGVATAQILPGITHVMNRVSEPDYTVLEQSDIGTGVDSSVSDAVADFLDAAMP